MKLKTLLTAALALLVAGLLSMPDYAEAKRFGGGANFGKQYKTMPPRAQKPIQSPSAAAAGQRTPQSSGASRWLGPLAGLAAGGLLASLFFGDAFEGFQFMDFLLIAALVIGAVMLFRMLRRGQLGPSPAAAGAYVGSDSALSRAAPQDTAYARESVADLGPETSQETPVTRASGFIPPGMGETPRQPAGNDQSPPWLDDTSFIEGAKTHFIRLQAAWDKADFRDIRDYTTPQLFAELQRERERLGGEQYTEVVQLQAEVLTVQREADRVVASVRFWGLIREDEQGVAEQFNEVWHVQHPWASPEGDWHIAGIQQV
jgi:predicted lipid-binding transport protein (Tim44 family)